MHVLDHANEEVKASFVESVQMYQIEQQCRESDIKHIAQEDSQSQVYKNLLMDSEGVRASQDAPEVSNNNVKPYQEATIAHNDQEASRDHDATEVVADKIR